MGLGQAGGCPPRVGGHGRGEGKADLRLLPAPLALPVGSLHLRQPPP